MSHVITIRQGGAGAPFEARQNGLHAQGATLGAALDALLAQLGELDEPLLIVPQDRPDRFFSQVEFDRLQELQVRTKGDGEPLTAKEQSEMRELIAKEFRATIQRTDPMLARIP